MLGWWVKKDGTPLAWKSSNTPPRSVRDAVFIPEAMPDKVNDPFFDGTPYIWDFANKKWMEGTNPVRQDKEAYEQKLANKKEAKRTALENLEQKPGNAPVTRDDISEIIRYLKNLLSE